MLCNLFQAFPDALFHQLLVAMAHPDHETRVAAHSVFSILLMPSLLSPWSDQSNRTSEKAKSESLSFQDEGKDRADAIDGKLWEESTQISDISAKQFTKCGSHGHSNSFKRAMADGKTV